MVFGDKKRFEEIWSQVQPGDKVFFYCVRPVSGLVGLARLFQS